MAARHEHDLLGDVDVSAEVYLPNSVRAQVPVWQAATRANCRLHLLDDAEAAASLADMTEPVLPSSSAPGASFRPESDATNSKSPPAS